MPQGEVLKEVGPRLSTDVLQSNRLTKISGLSTLTSLKELYLSENGLTAIEGLSTLV